MLQTYEKTEHLLRIQWTTEINTAARALEELGQSKKHWIPKKEKGFWVLYPTTETLKSWLEELGVEPIAEMRDGFVTALADSRIPPDKDFMHRVPCKRFSFFGHEYALSRKIKDLFGFAEMQVWEPVTGMRVSLGGSKMRADKDLDFGNSEEAILFSTCRYILTHAKDSKELWSKHVGPRIALMAQDQLKPENYLFTWTHSQTMN